MSLSSRFTVRTLFVLLPAIAAACDGVVDDQPDPDDDNSKRVFVTGGTFTGNLGGAAGADAICEGAAEAAGRAGTFKAWVSTTSENAIDRIADVGPWLDYSDATIFVDKAALNGVPTTVLRVTETNVSLDVQDTPLAWTGTAIDGTLSPNGNCLDWSSESVDVFGGIGQVALDSAAWTDTGGGGSCDAQGRLYCFQQ